MAVARWVSLEWGSDFRVDSRGYLQGPFFFITLLIHMEGEKKKRHCSPPFFFSYLQRKAVVSYARECIGIASIINPKISECCPRDTSVGHHWRIQSISPGGPKKGWRTPAARRSLQPTCTGAVKRNVSNNAGFAEGKIHFVQSVYLHSIAAATTVSTALWFAFDTSTHPHKGVASSLLSHLNKHS